MRKKNIVLLSAFLCGLLLCGIGAGVMFGEFSGLSYGGTYTFTPNSLKTETVTLSLDDIPEGPVYVDCYMAHSNHLTIPIESDPTLAPGEIRVTTTYDPENAMPLFDLQASDPSYESGNHLNLSYYSTRSDISLFMEVKDIILKDLKDSIIRDYHLNSVQSISISASPETAERLVF